MPACAILPAWYRTDTGAVKQQLPGALARLLPVGYDSGTMKPGDIE